MAKATIKQVAAEAGVSTATISRVLNSSGYVSDEVKNRVMLAVDKLQYQPNAIARSLKQDKSFTIGVVLPDISNPFFMTICRGLEDVVQEYGYHLIFCSSDELPEKEAQLLQLMTEKRVDAVVLATTGGNEDLVARMSAAGIQFILVDRSLDLPGPAVDLVAEDDVNGAYELTKQLILQGHSVIGVINGCMGVSTGQDRFVGCLKAFTEAGMEHEAAYDYDGKFTESGGREAVRYFLQMAKPPTALLSFNNKMTFGALLELTENGRDIPGDIAIASYGEVEAARLLKRSGIVYVDQKPYELGIKAGRTVLHRLEKGAESTEAVRDILQPVIKKLES
ncbi:LacI family DNA-binding transcriptional regulator [Paenibacillus sp. FSL H7-0331]|uniref:LacI family DNA-binding transcriptional regulator n=1 Tax=Paenibacillus sp. FSL H7-0331 TaxID=1920421 RepID=UPI00096D641A|nr:LacI family DNA-binding transcriptional regulator [Paenibacillus sp. FSL H7-0331]OMF03935.1 LacI family transcriptional regulator [Paenibacillus sp. FSL H7-0331]